MLVFDLTPGYARPPGCSLVLLFFRIYYAHSQTTIHHLHIQRLGIKSRHRMVERACRKARIVVKDPWYVSVLLSPQQHFFQKNIHSYDKQQLSGAATFIR